SLFESNGTRYVGLSAPVRLYGRNAVHGGEYAMAILVPERDLAAYAAGKSRGITALLFALFVCAMALAVYLSHRYLAPVLRGLEQIKRRGADKFNPTNMPEIDDLLDFLAKQDARRETERREPARNLPGTDAPQSEDEMFGRFTENVKTLSKAERKVFDLYLQGKTAQQITVELDLSINTIKTHNKRIYLKLDVTSREQLLIYIKMMRERMEHDK
ncbi:MAG: LuxR C-terminal-related transcriptional regulator, partial [Clostridiales bacterium]|nr:LuxR C-terminal-related transcriptional regulator [Clostridiales bacterium]